MADSTVVSFKVKAKEFWRRNQVMLMFMPLLVIGMFVNYLVLKSLDSRIGVEGFGDLHGYFLDAIRVPFILFWSWVIKKHFWFDLHTGTELDLFQRALSGDRPSFWLRVVDRIEWVLVFIIVTYWMTR